MNTQSTAAIVAAPFEPLLSVKTAAKLLGVPEPTLRDWMYKRQIPYVKLAGRVMFEPEVLREYIAARRVAADRRVM